MSRHTLEVLDLSYNCEIEDRRKNSKYGSTLAILLESIFSFSANSLTALYLQGREDDRKNMIWETNFRGLSKMLAT